METIKNFFKNRKKELVLFLALLLTAIFSGVNFGLILGLTLFFWTTGIVAEIPKGGKTLSTILRVVVIGVFIVSIIAALMTRSYQKRWIAIGRFDQFTSWVMGDQNMVKSSDIWEIEKEENSKKFREYYRDLLAQGKTKEAADTLVGFLKAWDLGKILKEKEHENDPIETNPAEISQPEDDGNGYISYYQAGDSPYFKLEPRQRTNWIKLSNFQNCKFYTNGDYYVVPRGGSPILVKRGNKPNLPNLEFYLKSLNETVSIKLEIS
jgi:hypothetical protein